MMHSKTVLLFFIIFLQFQNILSEAEETAKFLLKRQFELLKKAAKESNLAKISMMATFDVQKLDNVEKLFRLINSSDLSPLVAIVEGNKSVYSIIDADLPKRRSHSVIQMDRTNTSPSGWKIVRGQGMFASVDVCDVACNIDSLKNASNNEYVLNPLFALIDYDQNGMDFEK